MKLIIKNEPIFFDNKDFQTIQIRILFPFHRKEKDIAKYNILPSLINPYCKKYPTEEEFAMIRDEYYILGCYCGSNTIGNVSYFSFNMTIPDSNTLKKDYLEEQFSILHEMIYNPKEKNNHFIKEDVEREINNLRNGIEKNLNDAESYAMIQSKE